MPNLNTKLFCHSFQIQHGPVKKIPCISGINVVRLPEGLYLIWCFGQLSLKGQVLLAHVPRAPNNPQVPGLLQKTQFTSSPGSRSKEDLCIVRNKKKYEKNHVSKLI